LQNLKRKCRHSGNCGCYFSFCVLNLSQSRRGCFIRDGSH